MQNKVRLVMGGATDDNRLMRALEGKAKPMPPSGPFSKEQIDLIRAWIKQGAQNN